MKKLLALVLCLAMVFGLTACGGTGAMTMGTGGTAGTYYAYGGILGNQIKTSAGITVNVVSTDGSKANIQGIEWKASKAGIVEIDGNKITGGTVDELTGVDVYTEYEGVKYVCKVYVKASEA